MLNFDLKYGNVFCAIEFTFDEIGKECFNYLKLAKKKKELNIIESNSFNTLEELLKSVKGNFPVCLVFNNKNVLTKIVSSGSVNEREIIHVAFPNLNSGDFFYEVYKGNTNTLVSIVRKEYVNNILKLFEESSVNITDFYLGNATLQNILSYLNSDVIQSSNSKVYTKNNEINTLEESFESKNYVVNGLELSDKKVINFSVILSSFFNSNIVTESNKYVVVNNLKDSYTKKRLFSLGLISSLVFLFVVLLINFLFYSYYDAEIEKVETELSSLKNNKNFIEELQNKKEEKEEIIANFNSVLQSKISWYLDEIASIVPKNILLNEVSFQPLKHTVKKEKEILYDKEIIVIEGEAFNSYDVSKWVNELAQLNWIVDVIINDFESTKGIKNSFTLLVKIANEK